MTGWPLTIDGLEFHPIPESWVEHGVDHSPAVDAPRLRAVSVARGDGGFTLVIRYAARQEDVLTVETDAYETDNGWIPRRLADPCDEWPATLVASKHDPEGTLRLPEIWHYDTLWADRLADSDPEVVA